MTDRGIRAHGTSLNHHSVFSRWGVGAMELTPPRGYRLAGYRLGYRLVAIGRAIGGRRSAIGLTCEAIGYRTCYRLSVTLIGFPSWTRTTRRRTGSPSMYSANLATPTGPRGRTAATRARPMAITIGRSTISRRRTRTPGERRRVRTGSIGPRSRVADRCGSDAREQPSGRGRHRETGVEGRGAGWRV